MSPHGTRVAFSQPLSPAPSARELAMETPTWPHRVREEWKRTTTEAQLTRLQQKKGELRGASTWAQEDCARSPSGLRAESVKTACPRRRDAQYPMRAGPAPTPRSRTAYVRTLRASSTTLPTKTSGISSTTSTITIGRAAVPVPRKIASVQLSTPEQRTFTSCESAQSAANCTQSSARPMQPAWARNLTLLKCIAWSTTPAKMPSWMTCQAQA